MNRYAIYDPATGDILRIVQCHSSQALAQLQAGEALIPCAEGVNDVTHCVAGGVIVPVE